MSKNGRGRRHRRSFKLHSHVAQGGSTEELAAQLAPLEEQTAARQAGAGNSGGAIVVDTGSLHIPQGLTGDAKRRHPLGLEPVVLVIIALSLAFIAFVAWQITRMEVKTEDPPPASATRGG